MIVATGLTNCAADNPELVPLIEQARTTLDAHPRDVLADAGYRGEAMFQILEASDITAYISLGHEARPPSLRIPRPSAWPTNSQVTSDGQATVAEKHRRARDWLDQTRARLRPLQCPRCRQGARRVESGVPRGQPQELASHRPRLTRPARRTRRR